MRPEVSPDGKWLVYATREDSVTSLRIRELSSGDEHWLVHRVQRDDQESRFTRDLEPPFAFTPDGKSIVAAYLGHFWRVSVPDGKATMIPFSADYDEMIGGAIKEQYPFDDSTITVHQIRDLAPSPDGRRMAFTALDRIWVMDLPDGAPHRLVASSTDGEYSPAWSPDGHSIAYVTWSDISGGDIYRVNADGSGAPQKLTTQSAFYENLTYAPDGRRLVFGRGPRDMRRDRDELERPNAQAIGVELVWMPAAGGAATMIAPLTTFGQPHFGPDTSRIYVSQGSALTSMRWDGTDVKDIIRLGGGGRGAGGGGGGASNILLSPDGSRVLVQSGVQAYVIDDVPGRGAMPRSSTRRTPHSRRCPCTSSPRWAANSRRGLPTARRSTSRSPIRCSPTTSPPRRRRSPIPPNAPTPSRGLVAPAGAIAPEAVEAAAGAGPTAPRTSRPTKPYSTTW